MERGLIVELVHRQVKGLNIHPEIFVRYRRELVGVEFAGFNEIFEEVLFFVEQFEESGFESRVKEGAPIHDGGMVRLGGVTGRCGMVPDKDKIPQARS